MAYLANALWKLRKLKAAEEQHRRLIELWPNASPHYFSVPLALAFFKQTPANINATSALKSCTGTISAPDISRSTVRSTAKMPNNPRMAVRT
jgi:hypothetical protein